MRPVAGNPAVGNDLLDRLRATMLKPRSAEDVVRSIRTLREAALRQQARKGADAVDVKSGFGGIREIEFLVQGLQLIHAPRHPELIAGNTLDALEILKKAGQLPEATANHLAEDYVFLRRVEHFLQIMEDRQIHVIPREPAELEALGKRMMGPDADIESFGHRLHNCLRRVRRTFDTHLA
jgi:glutamate-ammonia-ligase adenylyltransferase